MMLALVADHGSTLAHGLSAHPAVAEAQQLLAQGVGGALRTLGKVVFGIFAGVFIVGALIGLLIGFFLGRAVGRKQGSEPIA